MAYGFENENIKLAAAPGPAQSNTPLFQYVRPQKKGEAAGLAAKNLVGCL
jgi:hypothetical protein